MRAVPGLALAAATLLHAARHTDTMRILDWNIARGEKLDAITRAIKQNDPDLILLQEVDLGTRRSAGRDTAAELARRLGLHFVFGQAFQELGQGAPDQPAYHGQAILTRLPILSSRVLKFQKQSGFWKPRSYLPRWAFLQRRLGGRIALVAELGESSAPIIVYNLHLESREFSGTRFAQLQEAIADARRYGPAVTVILAGDFNTKYHPAMAESTLIAAGCGPAGCSEARVIRGSHASDHDPISATIRITR